jgi:YbbR domain-containing protein
VRAIFTDRLELKATAILLAVLLWLVVGARQPTESYVNVKVEPELDSSLVLLDGPPQLQALVSGRAADIVKLYASPPVVRRTIDGDVPDTLVLDVSPSDVRVPPDLRNDVNILDVQPRKITLRFETRATRRLAVVNENRVTVLGDSGAPVSARVRFDPETVRITGPRRAVRRLRGIRPSALAIAAGDTLPHVADLDTSGLGVRVSPAQVKVRVRNEIPARAPVATP